MGTAKFVKMLDGWRGDARLYELSAPVSNESGGEFNFVIVSAVVAYSGPETYIFQASPDGKCVSFAEMQGSFRGELSHAEALAGLGFAIE